ncbi:uncharacterized protein PAC_07191 [Phialocephala subalpina]|uniref:Uncharacterized protein n=1 Tax=Phialocephala subalpina TaxID=576137 RepID=A0A1L7WX00_9HELO|nr:uncharacterized protein PAC_07191 [Phialocephala subalpina]
MPGRQPSLIVKLPMTSKGKEVAKQPQRPATRPSAATASHASKQPVSASLPAEITGHFSQSQLAIALSISKSKPEGLSTKEYFQQLRKHVKLGQPVPRDDMRYVDTAEFWKDQYSKLHLEKKALEDKVHCLEEARRLSRKRVHGEDDGDAAGLSEDDMAEIYSSLSPPLKDLEMSLANDDFLRLNSYALRIGRQRTALETTTLDSGNLDKINALAAQTLQVLALLKSALPECCLPLRLLKDKDENAKVAFAFQQVMNQSALAFLACLTAIDDLCRTIPGRANKAEIVYRMVMIFKQGLNLLQTVNDDQGAHQAIHEGHSTRHKSHKRQRIDEGEFLVNKYLTKALAGIAHNAQWKVHQPAHSEILEGLLSSILEHTGRLVSEAVFGEHVATSNLPGNITRDGGPVVRGFTRPEARYIVEVLHATTGTGTRSGLITQMLAAGKTPLNSNLRTSNPNSPDFFGNLLSKAKELLQSTLMKSAVGGADLDGLRLPTPPPEMSIVSDVADMEKYGKDWLIEMVWGLIGWDLVCLK